MSLIINLTYDPGVPSAMRTTVAAAAAYLESQFSTPITINMDVGFGELNGQPQLIGGRSHFDTSIHVTYQSLRSALLARGGTADERAAAASLPASDPTGGGNFGISPAEAAALGLYDGPVTGTIALGSSTQWTFGTTNEAAPGSFDAFGTAEHEITEVMGRTSWNNFGTDNYRLLDLFRYSTPGVRDLTPGPGFFSIDGSNLLALFNNPLTGGDAGDWNPANQPGDPFDAFGPPGLANLLTSTDLREMDVLGYSPAGVTPSAPAAAPALAVEDTTTGATAFPASEPYTGPVAGLQQEYINITSDSINVSGGSPDWFIHSGSGNDAIEVSSGTNVLDGGAGSNFLTGGSGADTFFIDDRRATADIWSTVGNFHAGDATTIWGVTPQDFTLDWVDGQGTAAFTGLTLHATASGKPTASLTLAGFNQTDLSSGRLSVLFDSIDGNDYMYIHANS